MGVNIDMRKFQKVEAQPILTYTRTRDAMLLLLVNVKITLFSIIINVIR